MLLKSPKLTRIQKEEAVIKVFEQSAPKIDFYLMLMLSTIIVTLGLLMNSSAIVIGGMLIAPILFPLMSFSMGMVVGNFDLMKRSGNVIWQSILTVIVISFVISSFFIDKEMTSEIISRISPNLGYFIIASVSGAAVAYALVKPALSEILPGIAISVALIPPLSVVGISFSFLQWNKIVGSFELFLLNLIGIIFAAIAVFSMMRLYEVKDVVERKMRSEEKIIEQERKKNEKGKIKELEKKVLEVEELLHEKEREV